jgi:homoserine O-acetyltransferase
MPEIFHHHQLFTLESGYQMPGYHLAYTTLGVANQDKSNVVWVFHALTANSDPAEWWPGLIGEGKLFDPAEYFIVCVNMPGSSYGSIGPFDLDPLGNEPYYHDFPFFTPRDMIHSYGFLREHLGIKKIKIGIGGSMGGQQLLEWAIEEPGLFEYIIPIATNAQHSPWGIAFNSSQRLCIELDPTWRENNSAAGLQGMKVARSLALLSYRNYETYELGQPDNDNEKIEGFNSESYQKYQGEKLAARFNAFSYYILSRSMDAHNVGRNRGGVADALKLIQSKTLVIGISTDILFPVNEQQFLAASIKGARFHAIHSRYGHDGFLLEFEQIEKYITGFIPFKNKIGRNALNNTTKKIST